MEGIHLFQEPLEELQKQIHIIKKARAEEYGFYQNTDRNILRHIAKYEKIHQEKATSLKISQELGITQATITPMIERLVKQGYITKKLSTTDKRAKLLSLTTEGIQYLSALIQGEKQQIQQLIHYLGEKDTQESIRLLQKITDFLREKNQGEDT